MFDNKIMNIYDEFFSIIKKLNETNIQYAVVGGIALSFHTQPRYTKDIDLLLLADDIDDFKSILKKMGYTFEANPWTFKDTNITLHRLTKIEEEDSLTIDLLVGNEERHKEIIKNAVVEKTEYGLTCIASREDLIWMKRFRNSKQDIADIEALENDKDTESS
ncbi:MAG: nucleotidyltransferase [Thermodesulfobacteriota bacterium]|nr:nucleotidyltransferase [Thermodesulfobacteriota bacterium]